MNVTDVKAPPARGRASTEKAIVVDAAIRCFAQYGPQRTSMTDIAEEAGVSRKTLYRMFEDRPSLVEHVLLRLFGAMRDEIAARVGEIENTREAILNGLLVSVDVAQEDRLFNEIIRKDTNYKAEQLLIHGNEAVLRYMSEYWGPVLDRGRDDGLIKPSLSNDQIYQMMMSYHAILLMRDDAEKDVRREFLSDLLEAVFVS